MSEVEHAEGEVGGSERDEVASGARAVAAGEETTVSIDVGAEAALVRETPAHRPSGLRRGALVVLITLSCLAVVLSGLTGWSHSTLMDTDGFVQVAAPSEDR